MKPVIGITPIYDSAKSSYWMLPGYMKGLEDAGALPVMLPMTDDEQTIGDILSRVDGILFSGGDDINPALYGETMLPECGGHYALRDRFEKKLMERALIADMPMLCICRGFQLMNVVFGGTLYQDIPTQLASDVIHNQGKPYENSSHGVEIYEDTPLYSLLQKDILYVNSRHHQGIKDLSPILEKMAESPDGLTEAVYISGCNFAWGLQWHPEHMHQVDKDSQKIFEAFVRACGKDE